jgi:hypothetical protein
MHRGMVEDRQHGELSIRDLDAWDRYLAAATMDGVVRFAGCVFDSGPVLRRGHVAVNVVITTPPAPVDTRTCQTCWMPFVIDALNRARYRFKKMPVPSRCKTCRRERRLDRVGGMT